jgi:hypothetical protein
MNEQQLRAAENAANGQAVASPPPTESWFSAPGRFTFGLPRNFRAGRRAVQSWGGSVVWARFQLLVANEVPGRSSELSNKAKSFAAGLP